MIDLDFSAQWNHALKLLFAEFAPASITSALGGSVHIEAKSASDLSLSATSRFCHQYLKMKPGDMAIVNDPSSGGSSLAELSVVRAVSLAAKSNQETDYLLAIRFQLGGTPDPKAASSQLRIPPTPIGAHNQFSKEILTAIASHPGASVHFEQQLLESAEKLKKLEAALLRIRSLPGIGFTSDQLETYFESTKKSLLSWISKTLANGEFQFQHRLSTGDLIKLKIECRENENILFDFVGTSTSENFELTEYMSFAACFAALVSLSVFEIPANQGSFSALQLRTPQNSMLNARQIKNPFVASRVQLPELCQFLRSCLLKLTRSAKNFAADSDGIGPASLTFQSQRVWDFHIPGGQGATQEKDGALSFSNWSPPLFGNHFSVETTETRYPIQFQNISRHHHNLGKGLNKGGAGIQLSLTLNSDAELHLIFSQFARERAAGQSGGKAGEKSEVSLENHGQKTEVTENFKQKLEAQTLIRFSSGGGGGWGEEKTDDED